MAPGVRPTPRNDTSGPGLMHYESRALRDELKASNARLLSAKVHVPPGMTGEQGAAMTNEWQRMSLHPVIDEENNAAAGHPQYEDMRTALLDFESRSHGEAPAKDRAFYSALRTLLQESIEEKEAGARETKLAATHRWYTKNRPRGGYDKDLAAVLATSLSVVPLGSGDPMNSPSSPTSERLRSVVAKSIDRHNLRTAYSRDNGAGGTVGTSCVSGGGGGTSFLQPSSRPGTAEAGSFSPAPTAAAGAEGPSGGGLSASVRSRPLAESLPFVQQPSSGARVSGRSAADAAGGTASSRTAGAVPRTGGTADDAGGTDGAYAYAPASMVRGSGLQQAAGGTPNRPGAVAGPTREKSDSRSPASGAPLVQTWRPAFKTESKVVTPLMGGSNATAPPPDVAPRGRLSGLGPLSGGTPDGRGGVGGTRASDVEALRAQWGSTDAMVGTADVNDKVGQWSLQRARLEEEIVRRQEATAYVTASLYRPSASKGVTEPGGVGGVNDAWRGELSAYGNLAPLEPGVYPPPAAGAPLPMGMLQRAYSARAAARAEYEQEAQAIRVRLAAAGSASFGKLLPGTSVLEHALMPVPDRPFVDCVGKLPLPGANMVSRPGSVPATETRKKKKRASSAKKKRAETGRR